MSLPVPEAKRRLRTQLRAALRGMSESERAAASVRLCARLQIQEVWVQARSVLFYAPRPEEVDVRSLYRLALEQGKTMVFPRFLPGTGQYGAARVCLPESDLAVGQFGILEPVPTCPEADLNCLDLLLVPGLGFSPVGWRLGRGRGFFDRLLAEASGVRCGIAFKGQVILEVPFEAHDIRLHYIVTPDQWLDCQGRQYTA